MTHDEAREFVERWKKAGPALEKVRREELRKMSHVEEALRIDDLIAVGLRHSQPTKKSGMVEMQHFFSKVKR